MHAPVLRFRFFLSLAMIFLVGAAFAGEQKPPLTCKKCDMPVRDEAKNFSAIIPKGIEFSAFDDLGCAIIWRNGECATRQMAFDYHAVAHDYLSGEEILMEKAAFVVDADIKTPMGYGIIAFRDKEQALKFAAGRGKAKVLTYQQILDLPLK